MFKYDTIKVFLSDYCWIIGFIDSSVIGLLSNHLQTYVGEFSDMPKIPYISGSNYNYMS